MADDVALGEVAQLTMGQSPPGSTYNRDGDGLPFFQGVADFGTRHPTPRVYCSAPTRVASPGDILFSVRAPIGRVNIANTTCATGRGLAILRPRDPKDARYIEFVLRSLERSWSRLEGGGSVFGNATKKDLETLAIPWPEPIERQAVGEVLGALDDRIELNRRMAQTLEEMARALFKSWFVDFDPVRAKAEGRDPGLPKHLADLFPDRLVNSELGEIPEGWDSAALSDVATLTQRSINPGSHQDRAWAHFSIPAFDAGRMPFSECGRQIKSGKYRVPSLSVLISKLNPSTPRVWLPDVTDEEWSICSTEFLPFVPVRVEWRSFLYELLRSAPFEVAVLSRVSGSTGSRQRVLPGDVASLRFVRPDDALIGEFSRLATHWHERTLAAMREAAELSALRELLLPLLVSGELRLPDPEGLLARLEAAA